MSRRARRYNRLAEDLNRLNHLYPSSSSDSELESLTANFVTSSARITTRPVNWIVPTYPSASSSEDELDRDQNDYYVPRAVIRSERTQPQTKPNKHLKCSGTLLVQGTEGKRRDRRGLNDGRSSLLFCESRRLLRRLVK